MSTPSATVVPQQDERKILAHETRRAVKNAVILGLSMLGTWSVAIVMWVLLPRILGPTDYGTLHFSDYFAMGFFAFTSLGVDNYIRKNVATRPGHASEFIGGVMGLRLVIGAVLIAGMWLVLGATGRTGIARTMVVLFGVGYLVHQLNLTLAALLQAMGEVTGLARVSVATKFIWAGGIGLGLILGLPMTVVPLALIASEGLKTLVLLALSRKHLDLKLALQVRATGVVLLASLPFYLNGLARTIYDKVDVTMIGFMMTDNEAGWYGASTRVTGVTLLLLPLVSSVVLPTASKAAAVSREDLDRFIAGTLRVMLTVAIPVAMMMALGADLWVRLIFGEAYAPAAGPLRVLALTFLFTYVATIASIHLFQMNKEWFVTAISLVALTINPLVNWFTIPGFEARYGDGGAGIGAAVASLTSEIVVVVIMTSVIGFKHSLGPVLGLILRTLPVVAAVLLLHWWLADLGYWRLPIDGVAYVVLALATRAIQIKDLRQFFNLLRSRRVNA